MDAWFREPATRGDAACILFCLPYGGGGATAFRSWRGRLPPEVDLAPVRLPGREERIREPHSLSAASIAAAITARADRPYGIYGHSLGALIGFEVIRELSRSGARLPVAFYPAAALPPDVTDPIASSVLLPDDEFLAVLIEQLGTPPEVRDLPALRGLLLPLLRADFRWLYEYRYQPGPPLPVPIMALAGAADADATPSAMLGWQRMTSASFRLHTFDGGHLFLTEAAPALCRLLSDDLREAAG